MHVPAVRPNPDPNLRLGLDPKVEVLVKQLNLQLFELHVQFKDRLFTDFAVEIDIRPLNLDKRVLLDLLLCTLTRH